MHHLRLRKAVVVAVYPNRYRVILTMLDGFELDVGGIEEAVGTGARKQWAWSAPAAHGQSETRDAAMEAFRRAWSGVNTQTLSKMRQEQEWTANKYALWEFGYRSLLGRGAIKCRCDEMFDCPARRYPHSARVANRYGLPAVRG